MNNNRYVGTLTLRLILGAIFFFQGYGKVVKMGVQQVYEQFFHGMLGEALPDWFLYSTAWYTSIVELLGGGLLLIGLFRNYALYALGSVLVLVSIGHGIATPIWDESHVLVRTVFLVALLLIPAEWDRWCIDTLLTKRSTS